ncbi:unnamed protein product [Lota lota]
MSEHVPAVEQRCDARARYQTATAAEAGVTCVNGGKQTVASVMVAVPSERRETPMAQMFLFQSAPYCTAALSVWARPGPDAGHHSTRILLGYVPCDTRGQDPPSFSATAQVHFFKYSYRRLNCIEPHPAIRWESRESRVFYIAVPKPQGLVLSYVRLSTSRYSRCCATCVCPHHARPGAELRASVHITILSVLRYVRLSQHQDIEREAA